jgi:hypothetical protein
MTEVRFWETHNLEIVQRSPHSKPLPFTKKSTKYSDIKLNTINLITVKCKLL